MLVEIKNKYPESGTVISLYNHLLSIKPASLFDFMGLRVEIDPIIDFQNQNVLVRWTDIDEGFNDKVIVKSLEDFLHQFTILAKC